MARYYDMDKLVELCRAKAETLVDGKAAFFSVAKWLDFLPPAADVAEVVRCKDCNYWTGTEYDGCCIKNGLSTRYAKDFCSYGERKEKKGDGVSDDPTE